MHDALSEREEDLERYGDAKRMLFATQLQFEEEDIQAIAVERLVHAVPGEPPCLVYVNEESGRALQAWQPIVQLALTAAEYALEEVAKKGVRRDDEGARNSALARFQSMMATYVQVHADLYARFAAEVKVP